MGNEKPRRSRGFHSSVGVVNYHLPKRIRLATISATDLHHEAPLFDSLQSAVPSSVLILIVPL